MFLGSMFNLSSNESTNSIKYMDVYVHSHTMDMLYVSAT